MPQRLDVKFREPETDDELQALIEEARRRARRRRLGYAAVAVAALATGLGLYFGLGGGGGGGDHGASSAGLPSPGAGGGAKSARSSSPSRQDVYERRCPDRGLEILPLTPRAPHAARDIAERTVGPEPPVTTTIRPAMHAGARGSELLHLCGPRAARRSLVVFTWDHRFDHGRNTSASLAQHAFVVFRSDNGYHVLYWEH